MNWLRRFCAWLWGIDMRAAENEARKIRRQVKIYDLVANVDELTRAIEIVAAAMPNGCGQVINGPIHSDIESRKAMLRHMIGGGSVLYGIDWQIHAAVTVTPSTQANGRTLLSVMPHGYFQQEGNQ